MHNGKENGLWMQQKLHLLVLPGICHPGPASDKKFKNLLPWIRQLKNATKWKVVPKQLIPEKDIYVFEFSGYWQNMYPLLLAIYVYICIDKWT